MKPQEAVGKKVIWTETRSGKQTRRVITKIAQVHNLSISLEGYPGIYFHLNGEQRRVDPNCISKIQLIDENYALLVEKHWKEDEQKRELINFITENKKYLISLDLDELQTLAESLQDNMKYIKLTV